MCGRASDKSPDYGKNDFQDFHPMHHTINSLFCRLWTVPGVLLNRNSRSCTAQNGSALTIIQQLKDRQEQGAVLQTFE